MDQPANPYDDPDRFRHFVDGDVVLTASDTMRRKVEQHEAFERAGRAFYGKDSRGALNRHERRRYAALSRRSQTR